MAQRIPVRLNLPGLNTIMRSPEARAIVDSTGQRMAAAAGDGFEYVAAPHRWVARGYVQPANARAMREQARTAALERALGQIKGSGKS
ncbi:hypothetical protein [Microbacterium sp. K36]|uniref:hypothetical protein n=1 Tax=Microbacterium sp. K36 TaxID=2305439 RepID=UPI00109D02FD|nr:hypothetical protein [Microbacterium sp. K36]